MWYIDANQGSPQAFPVRPPILPKVRKTGRFAGPLVRYSWGNTNTGARLTHPAGKARTMPLTLIGRPGKIETHGWAVLFRLQKKSLALFPKDSLAANQDNQFIIEGYPLMQGSQHVLLAQSCVNMLQQRAQKQAQPQIEATP
jgi:hypothetical protein